MKVEITCANCAKEVTMSKERTQITDIPDEKWNNIYIKSPKNGEECISKRSGEEGYVGSSIFNNGNFETYEDHTNRVVITRWKSDLWLPINITGNNDDKLSVLLTDIDLCRVEGGEFVMGDDNSAYSDEKPAHRVLVSGFYIGKFQVTQRLWKKVMGNNPSHFNGDSLPVENVSWYDVQAFIDKLNDREDVQDYINTLSPGSKFRLPTEAEWEFAARGGIHSKGYKYSGSNELEQVGWYTGNSDNKTHEVGQLLANELGIHDMSGNVWEWCQDWYSEEYYEACHKRGVMENPQGRDSGTDRVLRGGGWFYDPVLCRSVYRFYYDPDGRLRYIGFRLVLPFQES